jgi:hypothetical protein
MRTVKSPDCVGISTVATWVNDLTPTQLLAVTEECGSLKTHVFGVVRRTPSGLGGETDPHGHTECSGVNSRRPGAGSPRGITFACGQTARFWPAAKTAKLRGLTPRYFTLAVLEISSRLISPVSAGSGTFIRRFGSWRNALQAADLPVQHPRYTTEELLESVLTVADELGHMPSTREYDAHGISTSQTVCNHCGS